MAFAILAMSVDLLLGFTGLSSMGQAAYFGVGAYLTAVLATKFHFGMGWDFWLVVVLGILLGCALAALFGLFAIRAGGVYFLMITLALGQCVWGLAYRWNSLTGGDNGINMSGRPNFGLDLGNEVTFFYLVFALLRVSSLIACSCWCARRSAAASPASASANCACRSSATIRGCTNTSPSSSPAASADWPACCGRTPTATSARKPWC